MTIADLEAALTRSPDIGAPDYADEGMLQYLRAERIIPPYQTRGYKLVELVRIYESARHAVPNGRAAFLPTMTLYDTGPHACHRVQSRE